jgi:hypothetical protein
MIYSLNKAKISNIFKNSFIKNKTIAMTNSAYYKGLIIYNNNYKVKKKKNKNSQNNLIAFKKKKIKFDLF